MTEPPAHAILVWMNDADTVCFRFANGQEFYLPAFEVARLATTLRSQRDLAKPPRPNDPSREMRIDMITRANAERYAAAKAAREAREAKEASNARNRREKLARRADIERILQAPGLL